MQNATAVKPTTTTTTLESEGLGNLLAIMDATLEAQAERAQAEKAARLEREREAARKVEAERAKLRAEREAAQKALEAERVALEAARKRLEAEKSAAERAKREAARVRARSTGQEHGWYTARSGKRRRYLVVGRGKLRGRDRIRLAFANGSKSFWVDASRVSLEGQNKPAPAPRKQCPGNNFCRMYGWQKGPNCSPGY